MSKEVKWGTNRPNILSDQLPEAKNVSNSRLSEKKSFFTDSIHKLSVLCKSDFRLEGQHFPCSAIKKDESGRIKVQICCRWHGCIARMCWFYLTCNAPLCLHLKEGTNFFVKFIN